MVSLYFLEMVHIFHGLNVTKHIPFIELHDQVPVQGAGTIMEEERTCG